MIGMVAGVLPLPTRCNTRCPRRVSAKSSIRTAAASDARSALIIRARISIGGLAYWALKSGLKESMTFKEKSPGGAITDIAHQIKIAQVPDIEFDGPDGERLAFAHSYTIGGDRRTELRFTQDFTFIIEADSLRPTHDDCYWPSSCSGRGGIPSPGHQADGRREGVLPGNSQQGSVVCSPCEEKEATGAARCRLQPRRFRR